MSLAGCAMTVMAQKAVLKAGTAIPLQSVESIYARNVEVGQDVMFRVVSDVMADGKVVIPQGTIARGKVEEAKKSSLAGTKGRLTISVSNITLASGQQIFVNKTLNFNGKNRTPLAVVTALFIWPCIFIPGSAAYMPEGYTTTVLTISNSEIDQL